jgi:NADP-dependent 3-hydroxy acid dehydrogenase YdfG
MVGTNLTGVFYGLKAQIPALLDAGGGAIVNIACIQGQVARAGIGPYVASKQGGVGLDRLDAAVAIVATIFSKALPALGA